MDSGDGCELSAFPKQPNSKRVNTICRVFGIFSAISRESSEQLNIRKFMKT